MPKTVEPEERKKIIAAIRSKIESGQSAKVKVKLTKDTCQATVDGVKVHPAKLKVNRGDLVVWFNEAGETMRLEVPEKLGVAERHGTHAFIRVLGESKTGYDYWIYSGTTRVVGNSDPRIIVN